MDAKKPSWLSHIFWIDGLGGLVAGVLVLALHGFLSDLYGLPEATVLFIGVVNVLYSPLGLTIARKQRRATSLIVSLAAANLAWTFVCASVIVRFAGEATPLGLAVLGLEGAYVGALAYFEWRYRAELTSASP